jgi:hypothetical protein
MLAALALASTLGACVATGDFGRVRPTLVNDNMHAWMGPAVARGPLEPRWHHQLTDEEHRLRDLAYPLIEPPYDRNRWYSVLGEYDLNGRPWPYPDRAAYASRLFQTPYRSQTARYNKLIEDIRNDVMRIEPFFGIAHQIADLDRKREQSLAYVSDLSREEHANTLRRIAENRAIVRWVRESVRERALSYRIALERLVIAAPGPVAAEADRALTLLQQRIAAPSV